MVYVVLGLILSILVFVILIWLRKVQFDAVHQNFLDLVDKYGGRVIRDGFAIRPKFSGLFKECRLSISISSEKKTEENPRRFYISIYFQSPGQLNFTLMSNDWLNLKQKHKAAKRITKEIARKKYALEVSDKNLLKRLDIPGIERIINKMHPFAYVLVSQRGLILERISNNLIADTEYEKIQSLLEAMYDLSLIPPKVNNRSS